MILRGKANLSVRTKLALEKLNANFVLMVSVEQRCMSMRLERLHAVHRLESNPSMVHGHLAGRQHGGQRDAMHALDCKLDGRCRVRDKCGELEA